MLARILPKKISDVIFYRLNYDMVYELRLRVDMPVMINYGGKYLFLTAMGVSSDYKEAFIVGANELHQIVVLATERSLYSVNNQLSQGYITIEGGVRIGVCGEVVTASDSVKTIKDFTALNIRFPRQVIGCADKIYDYVVNNDTINNSLVISPPGAGKTTVLRDLCRKISEKLRLNILLVDERRELSASEKSNALFSVGKTVDIVTNCTKKFAFEVGIRSMRPDIIITDELITESDYLAVCNAIMGGVKVIASIHAGSIEQLSDKSGFNLIFKQGVIDRYILFSANNGPGTLEGIYDATLNRIS